MKLGHLSTAAIAALLLAGAAQAQDQPATTSDSAPSQAQDQSQAMPAPDQSAAPAATTSATDASATTSNPRVVANSPIPDTAENRALHPPLSAAGRNTKPRGN